jgi:hypothetical protein
VEIFLTVVPYALFSRFGGAITPTLKENWGVLRVCHTTYPSAVGTLRASLDVPTRLRDHSAADRRIHAATDRLWEVSELAAIREASEWVLERAA